MVAVATWHRTKIQWSMDEGQAKGKSQTPASATAPVPWMIQGVRECNNGGCWFYDLETLLNLIYQ